MKPLRGKKILVTRDLHQAAIFESRLSDLGAEVVCIPTIKIADPPDWKTFDSAAAQLSDFDWVLLSSSNAVHQFIKRLEILDFKFSGFNSPKIGVVGNQTAAVAESYGLRVDLIPDLYQAEGLVSDLLEIGIEGQKILIPRAVSGRDFVLNELTKAGANVRIVPVYQNIVPFENRSLLKETIAKGELDWITFTSSSTAKNFCYLLDDSIHQVVMPKIASIGNITSKTLRNNGLTPHVTASPQNIDGIIKAIMEWESDDKLSWTDEC